jgi:Ca-activated chloride channel homolog
MIRGMGAGGLQAAVIAGLLALGGSAGAGQQIFRSGIELVHFPITVLDRRGQLIHDLTADDFEIHEDGRRQEILHFVTGLSTDEHDELPPLRLGLLLDASGSMGDDMRFARTAVIKFLNALPQAEDITVVDFDGEVRLARYGQADVPRLIERIRGVEAEGWTALYDALGVYLHSAEARDGQKVVVLYSDGGDTRSAMRYSELMDLLKTSDVTLYAIGLLENQPVRGRMEQRMRLQQIAGATGGEALFPTSARALEEMYDRILEELRSRYTIGYASTNPAADGTWRQVEVRLTRPDLRGARVRTRAGYFAPLQPPSQP